MRTLAEVRKLTARATKVADAARLAGPTGEAYAKMLDDLVAVIEELRDELNHEKRQNLVNPRRKHGR